MDYKISKIIKKERKQLKLTQEELGKKVKLSRTTIANYEEGRRKPDVFKLQEIAKALNIPIGYLLGYQSKYVNESELSMLQKVYHLIGYELYYNSGDNQYYLYNRLDDSNIHIEESHLESLKEEIITLTMNVTGKFQSDISEMNKGKLKTSEL